MNTPAPKLLGIKAVAVGVADLQRAHRFYGETLALPPILEDGQAVGFHLGDTILLVKDDWYGLPTTEPNPRITVETDDAQATEAALRARGVTIADPVAAYGTAQVGSFLDSEGNKLWFCSRPPQ